jgi:3-hydroxyisobutyrate dehydrogenase-like beta-hydroxyacid dehydrogenase
MGFGMAESALKAGFKVYGFDPNSNAVQRFTALGGDAASPSAVAQTLDVVVVVVVNAAQTQSVLFGDAGIVSHLKPGATVISCATVPPTFAKDMETQCNSHGVNYLDSPISGGSVKAASGQLTIMASGKPEAFAHSKPVLDALAEKVFELGTEAGPGSAMKVVNQLLAGVHIAAAAEAITFGISQGIEASQCVEVISQCAGTSWMFENRGPHIAQGDYTPHSSVEIFVKDLGIVSDIARQSRFAAPIAATALQQFVAASGMGHGGEDDSAVAKVYAQQANLELPEGTSE